MITVKKGIIAGISLLLILNLATFPISYEASGQEGEPEGPTESRNYPRYGFGAQFIAPSGGISSRVWLNPRLGFEGNAILWANRFTGLGGTTSLRLLYKLTPDSSVDFYLTGGGAYNFGPGDEELSAIGTGGISFEVFSDAFVLNLEFGMQGQGVDQFGMTFGSGFHYYF